MDGTKPINKLVADLLDGELYRLCLTRNFKHPNSSIFVYVNEIGNIEIASQGYLNDDFDAMHTLSNWRNLPFGSTKQQVLEKVVDENWDVIAEKNTRFFNEDES